MIPWKIQSKLVEISDSHGNSIEVPSYGSQTVDEILYLKEHFVDNKSEDEEGLILKTVCFFLRSRLDIPDEISDDEILQTPDGKSIPSSLLVELSNFFLQNENSSKDEKAEKGGKK